MPETAPTRSLGGRTLSSNRTPRGLQLGRCSGGDLPQEVRLALTPAATPESASGSNASLFPNEGLAPQEKKILSRLKADESTPIDERVEKLETQTSSAEIFVAWFELGLGGKVRQLPGKNFVKHF
jgi:DNA processing protein